MPIKVGILVRSQNFILSFISTDWLLAYGNPAITMVLARSSEKLIPSESLPPIIQIKSPFCPFLIDWLYFWNVLLSLWVSSKIGISIWSNMPSFCKNYINFALYEYDYRNTTTPPLLTDSILLNLIHWLIQCFCIASIVSFSKSAWDVIISKTDRNYIFYVAKIAQLFEWM